MKQIIAHVDMDCFYCSCELKKYPEHKGKPIIVGSTGNRGVVSAANYEARKLGVFSATPIVKARKLCPDGVYFSVDRYYYKYESDKIMQILEGFCDDMEQVSIDEAYLDITSFSENFNSLKTCGDFIKDKIYKETGLTCSIGISYSTVYAKIASDYNKPNGVTVITNPKAFLEKMPVEKIPGIGKVSKKYYNSLGIYYIGDLTKHNRFFILDNFGYHGIKFQNIANGSYFKGITHRKKSKSNSREHTFQNDIKDMNEIQKKFDKISEEVHDDLGDKSFKTVSIKVRYSDFTTITRDITLTEYSNSIHTINENVKELFHSCYDDGNSVRLIGIKLTKLIENAPKQMTLGSYFENKEVATC